MRRTVSVAVMAAMLLTAGAARAAPPAPPAASAPWAASAAPAASATPTPASAAVAGGAVAEQVGTVEPVDAGLSYLDADRSVTFHYPGATYVKVHLSRLLLLPGDYLTVSDPAGQEVYRYEAGPLLGLGELLPSGQWATSITGDTAKVTLHSRADPAGLPGVARLGAAIDKVARGFAPGEAPEPVPEVVPEAGAPAPGAPARAPRMPAPESVCGGSDSRDAVCYREDQPVIYRNSKAVARLLINGVELCTGFRVGPGNRLLTNHHCLADRREARATEVWFNYQCATCGGWAVFRPTKVRGDEVLATDRALDFTLFTVDKFAEVERFGYLELDPRRTEPGERIYVPQHPRGLPARVALDSDRDQGSACRVSDPAAHGYGWHTDVAYYCDTQGGSSGSPVLSRETHRVVGLHHFGGCPNSGVRMDLIYERIAPHLPPI